MLNKYLLNKRKEEEYLESSEIWELEGDPEVFLPYLASNVETTSTDQLTILQAGSLLFTTGTRQILFQAAHEIVHS